MSPDKSDHDWRLSPLLPMFGVAYVLGVFAVIFGAGIGPVLIVAVSILAGVIHLALDQWLRRHGHSR